MILDVEAMLLLMNCMYDPRYEFVDKRNDISPDDSFYIFVDKSAIQATLVEDSESFPEIGTTGK